MSIFDTGSSTELEEARACITALETALAAKTAECERLREAMHEEALAAELCETECPVADMLRAALAAKE